MAAFGNRNAEAEIRHDILAPGIVSGEDVVVGS
jgi:hypothetical protein